MSACSPSLRRMPARLSGLAGVLHDQGTMRALRNDSSKAGGRIRCVASSDRRADCASLSTSSPSPCSRLRDSCRAYPVLSLKPKSPAGTPPAVRPRSGSGRQALLPPRLAQQAHRHKLGATHGCPARPRPRDADQQQRSATMEHTRPTSRTQAVLYSVRHGLAEERLQRTASSFTSPVVRFGRLLPLTLLLAR